MADFKVLRGNRLLLDLPEKEESKVILDKETEATLNNEYLLKFDKLTVYAVGDLIIDIKAGDKVFVDPLALRSKIITVSICGKDKLVVSPFDVILVW